MALTTIYAANTTSVESADAVWTTMQAGPGDSRDNYSASVGVGCNYNASTFYGSEIFMDFDISSLAGQTIDAADFSFYGDSANYYLWVEEREFQLRANDFGGGDATTGDWVNKAGLVAATLCAVKSYGGASGDPPSGAYATMTSQAALVTQLQNMLDGTGGWASTGYARFVLFHDGLIDVGAQPATLDLIKVYRTTNLPKLDITYSSVTAPTLAAVQSGANISVSWS